MDNAWTRLVILLLADPHLLERGQRGKDGTTNPDRVLPLRRSNDLDLHCGWSQGRDFLLHTVSNAREHGATTGQHSVGVQVLPDVHVALHDGVVAGLVDASRLHAKEGRLEQGLGAAEPLVADGNHLPVRELVALLKAGAGGSCLHLLLKVQGHVTQLLFDVTHNLTLSSGCEGVATLGQDLHQVVGQITPSQIQTKDGMGESVALVDGHGVRHTITGVEHDASSTTRRVQRQHGLDGHVHCWSVEGLEHDLGHLLPVGFGIQGSLRQKNGVLLGSHAQLVVEGVVPDLLHVVPVGHDAVLDRVLQGQDAALALGLVTNVRVFLAHTHHHTLMPGSADDGGEDSARSVVSCKSGLAHAGTIVNDQRSNVVVTHNRQLWQLQQLSAKAVKLASESIVKEGRFCGLQEGEERAPTFDHIWSKIGP